MGIIFFFIVLAELKTDTEGIFAPVMTKDQFLDKASFPSSLFPNRKACL